MPNTKTIAGIQRGPDFEREIHEPHHVAREEHQAKTDTTAEINEPLIRAAVQAGQEVAETMGQKVDVKYDQKHDLIVMQFKKLNGDEVVRQIPPEEVIRTAEKIKHQQAQFIDSVI